MPCALQDNLLEVIISKWADGDLHAFHAMPLTSRWQHIQYIDIQRQQKTEETPMSASKPIDNKAHAEELDRMADRGELHPVPGTKVHRGYDGNP